MECVDFQSPIAWDAPLNRGLLRWWLCLPNQNRGNMWRDLSRRSDATMLNGATSRGASGCPGAWGSYDFDGTDDYGNLDYSIDFTAGITMAAWVKCDAFQPDLSANHYGNRCVWDSRSSSVNLHTLAIYNTTGQVAGAFNWDGSIAVGSRSFVTGGGLTLNKWHFVAATYDGTAAKVFQDGLEVGSETKSYSLNSINDSAIGRFSGADFGALTGYFDGQIASLALYGRGLRPPEVYELYRASKAGYKNELRWLRDMRNSEQASVLTSPAYYRRRRSA